MELGTTIFLLFMSIYSRYFFSLFSKRKREGIKYTNQELTKLRKIPKKTVEEQKKFISLKYPRRGPFKFKWIMIPKIVFQIFVFIVVYRIYSYLLTLTGWHPAVWQAILIVFIVPTLVNLLVLKRFNLQKDDVTVYLK